MATIVIWKKNNSLLPVRTVLRWINNYIIINNDINNYLWKYLTEKYRKSIWNDQLIWKRFQSVLYVF